MPEYKNPQTEPGMDRNLLLVFLVLAVAIFGSQLFMRKYAPPASPPTSAKPAQVTPPASGNPPVSAATPAPAPAPATRVPVPSVSKQAASESETVVENDLYRITFTNRGAQAKSWVLKKYQDDQGKPLDLVNSAAAAKFGYPLSLWTYDESLRNKLNSALYVSSAASQNLSTPAEIVFDYADSGLVVHKAFQFDDSYVVSVTTSVLSGGSPVYGFPAWPAGFGDQVSLAAYGAGQLEYQFNNDTEHLGLKKVAGGATLHGSYDWAGVSSQYFTAVFIPNTPENVQMVTLHYPLDIAPDPGKPNETRPADVLGVAVGRPGESVERLFVG
ncbi:MAG TPA: membrane protein insertase YidC, partial [Bryobacterales bacterium]|nr:membrane protein insertase YidC [Bryobacterales bacterium]